MAAGPSRRGRGSQSRAPRPSPWRPCQLDVAAERVRSRDLHTRPCRAWPSATARSDRTYLAADRRNGTRSASNSAASSVPHLVRGKPGDHKPVLAIGIMNRDPKAALAVWLNRVGVHARKVLRPAKLADLEARIQAIAPDLKLPPVSTDQPVFRPWRAAPAGDRHATQDRVATGDQGNGAGRIEGQGRPLPRWRNMRITRTRLRDTFTKLEARGMARRVGTGKATKRTLAIDTAPWYATGDCIIARRRTVAWQSAHALPNYPRSR